MSDEIVHVGLGERSYDIVIGEGLLDRAPELMQQAVPSRDLFLVWDESVASPYGKQLFATLSKSGRNVRTFQLPRGEATKSVAWYSALLDRMAEERLGRDCAVVALGGGVVGDLVGFAAATWQRGVPVVQVPTTLLAMVDSSVGGKTGINLAAGKNLVGAFWQPTLVLADITTLATLPPRERVSAQAEIIKYGVIRDPAFFDWLEANTQLLSELKPEALRHAVRRSCEIKAEVVAADEREGGLREILNFGHTIGHALEKVIGYGVIRHGEAVALGMLVESRIACARGGDWSDGDHGRLAALVGRAGLPTSLSDSVATEAILEATRSDKKARGGAVRYAIPTAPGVMERCAVDDAEVVAAIEAFRT